VGGVLTITAEVSDPQTLKMIMKMWLSLLLLAAGRAKPLGAPLLPLGIDKTLSETGSEKRRTRMSYYC
jgi:hypothetical protein